MTDLGSTVATPADRDAVLACLVAAFVADPVLRYLFPDDATYPRHAAAFFGHLFDKRVALGTVWTIAADAACGAVALWDAPGAPGSPGDPGEPDLPAAELARARSYDTAVHEALPAGPFWYLGVLGTNPVHAGKRWGRVLIAEGFRRADADGLPVVLETSNPANVEVYGRAGFEVVSKESAPLPVWIMRRPAAA